MPTHFVAAARIKVKKRRKLFLTLGELELSRSLDVGPTVGTASKLTATEVLVLSPGFVSVRRNLSELDVDRLPDTSSKYFLRFVLAFRGNALFTIGTVSAGLSKSTGQK